MGILCAVIFTFFVFSKAVIVNLYSASNCSAPSDATGAKSTDSERAHLLLLDSTPVHERERFLFLYFFKKMRSMAVF